MAEFILTEQRGAVGIATLNRPKALNALSTPLVTELVAQLEHWDSDESVRAVVIAGGERAFAAGADIREMADKDAVAMAVTDPLATWDRIRRIRKPLIAAVRGVALGGGCELAMMCDLIVAGETARFGQPEINIGVIPGAGGTQRLARTIGRAPAMWMVLTGESIGAQQALQWGLVSRVVPDEVCLDEAVRLAEVVAAKAPLAVRAAKEAVQKAFEAPLEAGLDFERRLFYFLFASADQREGMRAFLEKRRPEFQGR